MHEPDPLKLIFCVDPVLKDPEEGEGEYLHPPSDTAGTKKLYVPCGSKKVIVPDKEVFLTPSYVTLHCVFRMPDSENTAEQSDEAENAIF